MTYQDQISDDSDRERPVREALVREVARRLTVWETSGVLASEFADELIQLIFTHTVDASGGEKEEVEAVLTPQALQEFEDLLTDWFFDWRNQETIESAGLPESGALAKKALLWAKRYLAPAAQGEL